MSRQNLEDALLHNCIVTGSKFNIPINAAVAAAGSTNADAGLIVGDGFTSVTGPDDAKGVKLPVPVAPFGNLVILKLGDGADLKVYPNAGAQINALTATTGAITIADDIATIFLAISATQWITIPLVPS